MLLFSSLLSTSAQIFTNINANLRGVASSSSVAGDFNADGKLDLLTEGHNAVDLYTTIWLNLGSSNFTDLAELDIQFSGTDSGTVAAGDFYNVGRLDALVTGYSAGLSGPSTQLWRNVGNGTFMLITNSGLPGVYNNYVAVGDFDNDGKLDVVLWGTGANVQIDRNLGNGIFTNMNAGLQAIGAPSSVSGVFVADFDNDGYLDVLIGEALWHNLGNGTFTNIPSGLPGGTTAIGDFDNDGYLDVLAGGQVWRNLGDGTFTNYGTAIPATGMAMGDYDNDGFLDILAAAGNAFAPTVQVWRNLHNGTFTLTASMPGGYYGPSLTWADLNGDGRLDFLVTGQQGQDKNANPIYVAQVYRNISGSPSNAPPTAPTNLTSQIKGNGGVKLMWGAATDDHTPSSGLNYNIRVGTAPGGLDIVSPEANPLTGQRRVVQIGNAQERLFSLLTNLTGGTYYWSAQAIDSAFAGGAFATEATFVIPPAINGFTFTNGQFQVAFNALATNSYTLQGSTNLSAWVAVSTVVPPTNGPALLGDTNTAAYPRRYYRLSCP